MCIYIYTIITRYYHLFSPNFYHFGVVFTPKKSMDFHGQSQTRSRCLLLVLSSTTIAMPDSPTGPLPSHSW